MPQPGPTDLFAALTDPLRPLAERGEVRRYRKGALLIREGDAGDTLYIVLAGRVRAFSAGPRDREITYGTYGPGEYLGEMSLDGGLRSASVEALEPCVCSLVTRRTLEAHIAAHPPFAFDLLAKVIRRARSATLSAKQLALNDVYGRLLWLLNALAVVQDDGTRLIGERLTHRDMANRLGCSREMVSRLMSDLESGGYVRVVGAGLVVAARLPARW